MEAIMAEDVPIETIYDKYLIVYRYPGPHNNNEWYPHTQTFDNKIDAIRDWKKTYCMTKGENVDWKIIKFSIREKEDE